MVRNSQNKSLDLYLTILSLLFSSLKHLFPFSVFIYVVRSSVCLDDTSVRRNPRYLVDLGSLCLICILTV